MDDRLRSYRPEDADALLAVSRRALAREEEQVGSPLWATREELDAELTGLDRPPEETLRVFEDDGEAAAFGGIELEDEATVFGPLVAPAFRGRRLGRQLLEASVELSRVADVECLVAAVGVRNLTGRLLLERYGFRTRGSPEAVYRLFPGAHRAAGRHGDVTTRRAGLDDLERVLALCRECFTRGGLSDAAWRRGIERGQVHVGEESDQAVALVRINAAQRRVFHGVTADARARGVGGIVLSDALEAYWQEHPSEPLRLTVAVDNVPATRLYRRQGFAPWLVLQTFERRL